MNAPERYESIPTTVTAIQWTGENIGPAEKFCSFLTTRRTAPDLLTDAEIREQDGVHISVQPGAWIVRGSGGRFFTVPDGVFQLKYQARSSQKLGY